MLEDACGRVLTGPFALIAYRVSDFSPRADVELSASQRCLTPLQRDISIARASLCQLVPRDDASYLYTLRSIRGEISVCIPPISPLLPEHLVSHPAGSEYYQPYWLPFSWPFPFEFLGIFLGCAPGKPSLPKDEPKASAELWSTCERVIAAARAAKGQRAATATALG